MAFIVLFSMRPVLVYLTTPPTPPEPCPEGGQNQRFGVVDRTPMISGFVGSLKLPCLLPTMVVPNFNA